MITLRYYFKYKLKTNMAITITSTELVNALLIYLSCHVVSSILLNVLHLIKWLWFKDAHYTYYNQLKRRHKNDGAAMVAVATTTFN